MDPTLEAIASANANATERLTALVRSLTDDELTTPVDHGWTVSTVLAHLAYWDRRNAEILRHNIEGRWAPTDEPDWMDDVQNDALLAEWSRLSTEIAVALVIESAELIDVRASSLPEEIAAHILERDGIHLIRRSRHRLEHIGQIESALGR